MSSPGQKQPMGTTRGERGFTLIELLVVIGIIVALAGVTVPLVTKFTGSGKTGAMAAETETVQTAMRAMMAEQEITTVEEVVQGDDATAVWIGLPLGDGALVLYHETNPDARYLNSGTTKYYYCWTAGGEVYVKTPGDPEDSDGPGPCSAPPP